MRRIEESIVINRPAEEVFAYLEDRSHDHEWMDAVVESHWLDTGHSDSAATNAVGRRGRMVMRIPGRTVKFIDEVTDYEPGHIIAHRTIEGPFQLESACICEPRDGGCVATVVGEADRMPGALGRLIGPFVRRNIRRGFRADLARLKQIMER